MKNPHQVVRQLDEIVETCKEVKIYASEMASELTLDANDIFSSFESATSELQPFIESSSEGDESFQRLVASAQRLRSIVTRAAALGGMMGVLQDVYGPLYEISENLKEQYGATTESGLQPSPGSFLTLFYRNQADEDWASISRADLTKLPLLKFAEILTSKEHLFADVQGKSLNRASCLLELSRDHQEVSTSYHKDFSILIVDDDELVQAMLLRRLKMAVPDATVLVAYNVEQAIESLKSSPDVVFLDIHLPDGSGLEVLEEVRNSSAESHLPVFIMTADPSGDIRKKANDLVVSGFLDKQEVESAMRLLVQVAKMYQKINDQND